MHTRLFKKCVMSMLVIIMFLVSVPSSGGAPLDIETVFPEYILDGNITIEGTATGIPYRLEDNTTAVFSIGTLQDVYAENDAVILKPRLTLSALNGGNPVLTSDIKQDDLDHHCVVKVSKTYYMYYFTGDYSSGRSSYLRLATSSDGETWTNHTSNPILTFNNTTTDVQMGSSPYVYEESGTFHLFYSISNNSVMEINYANSTDGVNWSLYASNPVLRPGPSGSYDDQRLRAGSIVKLGNTYNLYYYGSKKVDQKWSLLLANSTDMLTWTKSTSNPLTVASDWWFSSMEQATASNRFWYTRSTNSIGYIWSENGLDWYDAGVLFMSQPGTFYSSAISTPWVFANGTDYLMIASCQDDLGTRTMGAFKIAVTQTTGYHYSRLIDLDGKVELTSITNKIVIPGNSTVYIYLRWGNSSLNLGDWETWFDASTFSGVVAQYIQYWAQFRASTDWLRPKLTEVVVDYTSHPEKIKVQLDRGAWTDVDTWPKDWSINISVGDGDHEIGVQAVNTVGNIFVQYFDVKVDLFPPTGNITIEEGEDVTNSTVLRYSTLANDTFEVVEYQVSFDPTFTGAAWKAYDGSGTMTYVGPDGPVKLYSKFKDAAGRISASVEDTIIVDTTPPVGNLAIDGGLEYTNSTNVTLDIGWTDVSEVVSMMISNDPTFAGAVWQDVNATPLWQLGSGDGEQRVYVRLKDVVGWTSEFSNITILDTVPPTATLYINEDAAYANNTNVTLDITLSDINPIQVKLAGEGETWPGGWLQLDNVTSMPWELFEGVDGPRAVLMLVRDAAGNEVMVSDLIVLDMTAPEGTLTLEEGRASTNERDVHVQLNAIDPTSGLGMMRVSSSEDFSGVDWENVTETFQWLAPEGDGTKTIYVELMDNAGNVASLEGMILLDTKAPTGSFTINEGSEYVTDSQVLIGLGFSDANGISKVRLSNTPSFDSATWLEYGFSVPWDLGTEEGEHWVYLEVADATGNTATAQGKVTLDLTDPDATIVINGGAEATLSLDVLLTWTAGDNIGLYAYRFAPTANFADVEWVPFLTSPGEGLLSVSEDDWPFNIQGPALIKSVYLEVQDIAGRTTSASDGVQFVAGRPEADVTAGDDSGWTDNSSVTLTVRAKGTVQSTHARYAQSQEGLASSPWVPLGETHIIELEGPDGETVIYVELLGPHNVTSEPIEIELILDTQAPVLNIVSPKGGDVDEGKVRFNLDVQDDLDASPSLAWRFKDDAWWGVPNNNFDVELEEGKNEIQVRATDAAGNVVVEDIVLEYGGGGLGIIVWVIIAAVAVAGVVAFLFIRKKGQ